METAFDAEVDPHGRDEAVYEDAAVAQTERTAESTDPENLSRHSLRMDDDGILKVHEADGITLYLRPTSVRNGFPCRRGRQRNSDDERELYDLPGKLFQLT